MRIMRNERRGYKVRQEVRSKETGGEETRGGERREDKTRVEERKEEEQREKEKKMIAWAACSSYTAIQ